MLLTALSATLCLTKKPNILDFGGSAGNDYFMCKRFLGTSAFGKYFICENAKVVEVFKDLAKDEDSLYYVDDIKEIASSGIIIHIAHVSGTLQYLKDPLCSLDEIIKLEPEHLFINRTPFWEFPTRLTKQLKPKSKPDEKVRLSYPCWILNETEVVNYVIDKGYEKINFSGSYDRPYISGYGFLEYKNFFFRKNNT